MKKLYIQPTIEVETIETSAILAGSPEIKIDDAITGGSEGGIITEGDGSDIGFTKRGHGITWDYNSKYDWDL